MSAVEVGAAAPGFLSKERIIAGPGFNRWVVPPAALAIHLCIGMAYGFSVFWLPLSRAVGITTSIACPKDFGLLAQIMATTCDWKISMLGWTYTLLHAFTGGADGSEPRGQLAIDGNGNVFGTTFAGANPGCFSGCGVVFEITP